MRRTRQSLSTIIAVLLLGLLATTARLRVAADTANVPSLVISQLKITSSNGQFVTLYNTTNSTLDMSKYQLQYFNSYDLSKATSSKLIALSGLVPPHGYFMVNDSALLLCYQLTIDSVSLGLSSTAGLVEVLGFNQASPGSSVSPVLQDYVGWSKTAATGAQTLPTNLNAFLLRQPADVKNNPTIVSPGSGSWQTVQPDTANACDLVTNTTTPTLVATGLSQLLPATEPPAIIVTIPAGAGDIVSVPVLPASDVGLMAPQITEILPNPSGTGNDGTDEYVELYNANSVDFDLSGFSLQVGTTSLHTYKFPASTTLPANGFKAFYSLDTGLSLSNSGGQVKLLDPFGNSLSASDVYGSAKDGQTWALAKGNWYWTLKATPGAANVINQPVAAKKTSAKTTAKTSSGTGKVKAAKTKLSTAAVASSGSADPLSKTPIHPWTLALVGVGALLYGAYEYRADLANRIYQFRSNLGARRGDRP